MRAFAAWLRQQFQTIARSPDEGELNRWSVIYRLYRGIPAGMLRMPVSRFHRVSRAGDEQQHDCHFYKYNDVIDVRRLANSDHEQQRNNRNDDDRWQIEDGRDLCSIR